ncbi:MAG: 3-carboxy-cis,cis-muconate cycloisomerase [Candidatus Acidiferrales bacterium]
MSLLEPLFRWDVIEALFTDRAHLQGILDFEAALVRAEARTKVIPKAAAPAIAGKCKADLFDSAAIAKATALAGNPAIPLIKQLTSLVAKDDKDAARFVHWGATSQDAIDTGFVLQLRGGLAHIEAELERLGGALAQIVKKHRSTPIVGRTWLQQALPTTFGLKAAGWLDAVNRHRVRIAEARRRAMVLQFGGAVGTLAALGNRGADVAEALGDELHLAVPDAPWHAHRDRVAEVATALGLFTGTLGKIARDISLSMQTEVAEVHEPAGENRGGSSTLPHKRNPVTSAVVLAAATRIPGLVSAMLSAMVQEQERGLGGWQAEWELMPEIIGLSGGALHHLTDTVAGLEIDTAKMAQNLDVTHGLIFAEAVQMALAGEMGRSAAHDLVEAATKRALAEKRHLREVLAEDAAVTKLLKKQELDRLFDPRQYLGVAETMIDRVLATHSSRRLKAAGESE